VENVKDEGEGEEEEQWLAVEIAGVGGELLSTLRCSCEQWRMQKMKEKEKRKSSGRRRPVVKASCYSLFTALFLLFFLWPLFITQFATQHKRQLEVASGYLAV
jgi:hypothetical protein